MKRMLSIVVVLILSVLMTSTMQFPNVNAATNGNTIDLSKKTPLTNDEIKAAWPNLPTAAELWASGSFYYMDTSIDSTQFLDASPANYTADTPNLFHGGISRNEPHIWLQYNATIWVQVPIYLLQTSNQVSSDNPQPLTATLNWAYGLYANPTLILVKLPVQTTFTEHSLMVISLPMFTVLLMTQLLWHQMY